MGLWGVLLEFVRTAATHAAPHVAKGAVDIARERMNATRTEPQAADPVEQLNKVFSAIELRLVAAEQRAAATEEQMTALQDYFTRKWASARIWVIGLLAWNAVVTAVLIYVLFARR